VTLQVIGAGFGRTGTLSTKLALEQLGFGPCHHMEEVLAHPEQVEPFERALAGETVDWHAAFAGYRAMVDWPGAHFWRELSEVFPDAKILLTVRDVGGWWTSYTKTIMKALELAEERGSRTGLMNRELIGVRTFGSHYKDETAAKAAFQRRIDDVAAAIPAERLLTFDVRQGWGPLCRFLDVAVPDTPFPRSNSPQEFWKLLS